MLEKPRRKVAPILRMFERFYATICVDAPRHFLSIWTFSMGQKAFSKAERELLKKLFAYEAALWPVSHEFAREVHELTLSCIEHATDIQRQAFWENLAYVMIGPNGPAFFGKDAEKRGRLDMLRKQRERHENLAFMVSKRASDRVSAFSNYVEIITYLQTALLNAYSDAHDSGTDGSSKDGYRRESIDRRQLNPAPSFVEFDPELRIDTNWDIIFDPPEPPNDITPDYLPENEPESRLDGILSDRRSSLAPQAKRQHQISRAETNGSYAELIKERRVDIYGTDESHNRLYSTSELLAYLDELYPLGLPSQRNAATGGCPQHDVEGIELKAGASRDEDLADPLTDSGPTADITQFVTNLRGLYEARPFPFYYMAVNEYCGRCTKLKETIITKCGYDDRIADFSNICKRYGIWLEYRAGRKQATADLRKSHIGIFMSEAFGIDVVTDDDFMTHYYVVILAINRFVRRNKKSILTRLGVTAP